MKKREDQSFFFPYQINESTALYLNNTLRSFALALIGIFIPIFIYCLPHKIVLNPDSFINNLSWVLLFFIAKSASILFISCFLNPHIFQNWGLKKTLLLSSIFLSLKLILLLQIETGLSFNANFTYLILLAGIIDGVDEHFYWLPYHILFIRKAEEGDHKFGKEASQRFFLGRLASTLGPFFGGLVIKVYGFPALFILSLSLIIISVLPIYFRVEEQKHSPHYLLPLLKKFVFQKKFKHLNFCHLGNGFEQRIYGVLWPIFVFVSLQEFEKVGTITSFSLLISTIITLWLGRYIDRHGPQKTHRFAVFSQFISHFPRIFFPITPQITYSLDIADHINSLILGLPLMSTEYEKASRMGESDFFVYRDFIKNAGMLFIAIIALLILPILRNWKLIFLLALLGSFLTLSLHKDPN